MKLDFQKSYQDAPDISSQEYSDLNYLPEANNNISLNDLSEEVSLVEILKVIENPDEHLNSDLPAILESLMSSKELDESNVNQFLVADLSRILIQYIKWVKCFPNVKPYYQVSSNNISELLKIIKKLGVNFICCEESEIEDVFNIENNPLFNSNDDNNNNNNNNIINKNFISGHNVSSDSSTTTSSNNKNNPMVAKIILSKMLKKNENENENENENYAVHGYSESFVKRAAEKGLKSFICNSIEEISLIASFIPDAKILLAVNVSYDSKITREETNRIKEIFEAAEELELSQNLNGLTLVMANNSDKNKDITYSNSGSSTNAKSFNNITNSSNAEYFNPKNIYEIFKRARELFDIAEEYGIELKTLDIGSPNSESFYTAENIRIFSESLEYFFADLQVELMAQLGRFFSASAFTLVTRNIKKNNSKAIVNNFENISNENILTISPEASPSPDTLSRSSHSSSTTSLNGLNSTEISGINLTNVSAINQNSYYIDLDLLPIEDNFINANNENLNFNKNFNEEFILNDSEIIIDNQQDQLNIKETHSLLVADNENLNLNNLNNFICTAGLETNNNFFYRRQPNKEYRASSLKPYIAKQQQEKAKANENEIQKTTKSVSFKVIEKKEKEKKNKKYSNFEETYRRELKKIDCNAKTCLHRKICDINNLESENIQQDWFVYENAGNLDVCVSCKDNAFTIPQVYYIRNRISLKLEKYFYVIMNKFDP